MLSKSPCLYINVGRVSEMRLCAVMNIFGIVPPNTKSGPSKMCSSVITNYKTLLEFVWSFFVCFFGGGGSSRGWIYFTSRTSNLLRKKPFPSVKDAIFIFSERQSSCCEKLH